MAETADLPALADTPKPSVVAEIMNSPKLGAFMTLAAVIALVVGAWLWNQQPDMKVLYGNLSDKDGGAVIAALQQMNIPYKFTEGGSILVPSNRVYEAKLQLASQGLPKGGTVGMELMDSQKLGTSQFQEQVNYQRGLEGELARTIQSLAAVESARVHLGLSKPSVFLKDQQKPTASVLVNLRGGHSLDKGQVSAIVHLVSNSVPDLPPRNVSVVDQQGNLLSDPPHEGDGLLDEEQLKYVHNVEQNLRSRVQDILAPVLGADNVRAEITAELDFTRGERANESYKPNQDPNAAAVRSTQVSQSTTRDGAKDGGVPGALTNQPPADAKAPITAPKTATTGASGTSATPAPPTSESKDATTNYEVDKQVEYVQRPAGSIKRLSVAVVVNNKREVDAKGNVKVRPLTDPEKAQLLELVQNAVGYDKSRGDVVNVVNTSFSPALTEVAAELPFWKQPDTLELAKEAGRYLLLALAGGYLWFGYIRPAFRKINGTDVVEAERETAKERGADGREVLAGGASELEALGAGQAMAALGVDARANAEGGPDPLQMDIQELRTMAKTEPKLMAAVLRGWVND